jgi:hypothetical protein
MGLSFATCALGWTGVGLRAAHETAAAAGLLPPAAPEPHRASGEAGAGAVGGRRRSGALRGNSRANGFATTVIHTVRLGCRSSVAMTPEVAVSLAIFVVVFLVLSRLGSAKPTGFAVDPDVKRARHLIKSKIDEHGEALAQRYLEACEHDAGSDRVPGSCARAIEGFIGDVLLHDIALEHPGLGPAVREVVTLEREHVYALVLSRIEAHLTERGLA